MGLSAPLKIRISVFSLGEIVDQINRVSRLMRSLFCFHSIFTALFIAGGPIKVAIKKIPSAFDDVVDAKRIVREVRLLRRLDHMNIIKIVDILPPPSLADFNDVYIVSELMDTDLHRVIYSSQVFCLSRVLAYFFSIEKVRWISFPRL